MTKQRKQTSDEWWAAIRRSADLVKGQPVWTQAGIVLSGNFDGWPHTPTTPGADDSEQGGAR